MTDKKLGLIGELEEIKEDSYEDLKIALFNKDVDDLDDTIEADECLENVKHMKYIITLTKATLADILGELDEYPLRYIRVADVKQIITRKIGGDA